MMKQHFVENIGNDNPMNNETLFSLDGIDDVTASEEKTFIEDSDSFSEYSYNESDSGNDMNNYDSTEVEAIRQAFEEKVVSSVSLFNDNSDQLMFRFAGSIDLIPESDTPALELNCSSPNNKRRKSFLISNTSCIEKFPTVLYGSRKEFDFHSSLSQSKKKLKKLFKQLRRDDEPSSSKLEEKDKLKKSKESQAESSLTQSDKELRDEITNLRSTREILLEQRRALDAKINRDRTFSLYEERKFIELDEAIEALDATIEYKNGSICGRKYIEEGERENGEQMLLDRLMGLSEEEMRYLLCKYFQKSIDLRESGRNMEQQITELDHQIRAQDWKIKTMGCSLQQAKAENEKRLVMVHKEHEEKLHLMFRHYTGTGTSSSADTSKTMDESKLVPCTSQIAIPQQNLRKLQGAPSPPTTKVTRKKNKLIIQRQAKK